MSPRPQQLYKELDLFAFVGLIMLFGVVKKNAIMMIDFALEAQRRDGRDPRNAIYAGCLLRFRPIMMTTAAALFGTMPIALGYGEGAEARLDWQWSSRRAVDVKKTSASLSSTIKISTDVWAISTASANPDGFVGHPLHYRLGRNERGNGG